MIKTQEEKYYICMRDLVLSVHVQTIRNKTFIKKQKIKQIYGDPLALKLLALLGPPVVPYTTSEKFVGPSFYLLINMISSHL